MSEFNVKNGVMVISKPKTKEEKPLAKITLSKAQLANEKARKDALLKSE